MDRNEAITVCAIAACVIAYFAGMTAIAIWGG